MFCSYLWGQTDMNNYWVASTLLFKIFKNIFSWLMMPQPLCWLCSFYSSPPARWHSGPLYLWLTPSQLQHSLTGGLFITGELKDDKLLYNSFCMSIRNAMGKMWFFVLLFKKESWFFLNIPCTNKHPEYIRLCPLACR